MDGVTAAMIIGIGLVFTLVVGIASQRRSRVVLQSSQRTVASPPSYQPNREQQEDIDAVNQSIEQAREELMWLRDQVAKERARLERLRRQTVPPAVAADPLPGSAVETPWVVLGLRPGASGDDIRRRYRLLSRVWHPDRFIDGTPELRAEAEHMMARLNRAHKALTQQVGEPQKR